MKLLTAGRVSTPRHCSATPFCASSTLEEWTADPTPTDAELDRVRRQLLSDGSSCEAPGFEEWEPDDDEPGCASAKPVVSRVGLSSGFDFDAFAALIA